MNQQRILVSCLIQALLFPVTFHHSGGYASSILEYVSESDTISVWRQQQVLMYSMIKGLSSRMCAIYFHLYLIASLSVTKTFSRGKMICMVCTIIIFLNNINILLIQPLLFRITSRIFVPPWFDFILCVSKVVIVCTILLHNTPLNVPDGWNSIFLCPSCDRSCYGMGSVCHLCPSIKLYLVNALTCEIDPASPNSSCGIFMWRSLMSSYLGHLCLIWRTLRSTQCITLWMW